MIELIIKGKPVAKGRPRFYNGKAVTPEKTRKAEKEIQRQAILQVKEKSAKMFIDTTLTMSIEFRILPPKYWSRKKREQAINGSWGVVTRPDLDNYVKLVKDALEGVIYEDDRYVVALKCCKVYADFDETLIQIQPYERIK